MSKRFLVIVAILVLVILAGLFTIFTIATKPFVTDEGGFGIRDSTEMASTNAYVGTAIASTATAKAWTDTPTPTSTH